MALIPFPWKMAFPERLRLPDWWECATLISLGFCSSHFAFPPLLSNSTLRVPGGSAQSCVSHTQSMLEFSPTILHIGYVAYD